MEGSYPVGRELPSGNELPSGKRVSQWDKSFLVGRHRELPSGKRASQWEESFPVERELLIAKIAPHCEDSFPVGRELPSGRELPGRYSGGPEINLASEASGPQKSKQKLVGKNVLSTGKKNTFER